MSEVGGVSEVSGVSGVSGARGVRAVGWGRPPHPMGVVVLYRHLAARCGADPRPFARIGKLDEEVLGALDLLVLRGVSEAASSSSE